MSRKERPSPRAERIRALLEEGDHRAARAEARAVLADPGAPDEERARAAAAHSSLVPDRGVLLASALGVAAALAVALLVLSRT